MLKIMITLLGNYKSKNEFIDEKGNELKLIPYSYISKNMPNDSFGFFNVKFKEEKKVVCYSIYLIPEEEFNEYKNRGKV